MSRTFNGTSDRLTCALGGVGVFGASTCAAIARKNTPSATGIYGPLVAAGTGTNWELITEPSDAGPPDELAIWNGTAIQESVIQMNSSDGWCVVAMTKTTGTVAARMHKVLMGAGTATHTTNGGTSANSSTPATSLYLGSSAAAAGDFFKGDILVLAVWNITLTDAQIENLAYTKKAWFAPGDPLAMWVLDQNATTQSVRDLVGTSNQSALTGTTIATSAVTAWTYGT